MHIAQCTCNVYGLSHRIIMEFYLAEQMQSTYLLYVFIHFSNWVMHAGHSHFISKCQLAFDSCIKFENGTTHVQCWKCTHSNSLVLKMWIKMRTRYIIYVSLPISRRIFFTSFYTYCGLLYNFVTHLVIPWSANDFDFSKLHLFNFKLRSTKTQFQSINNISLNELMHSRISSKIAQNWNANNSFLTF